MVTAYGSKHTAILMQAVVKYTTSSHHHLQLAEPMCAPERLPAIWKRNFKRCVNENQKHNSEDSTVMYKMQESVSSTESAECMTEGSRNPTFLYNNVKVVSIVDESWFLSLHARKTSGEAAPQLQASGYGQTKRWPYTFMTKHVMENCIWRCAETLHA
jgi:hypothetical protein